MYIVNIRYVCVRCIHIGLVYVCKCTCTCVWCRVCALCLCCVYIPRVLNMCLVCDERVYFACIGRVLCDLARTHSYACICVRACVRARVRVRTMCGAGQFSHRLCCMLKT